MSRQPVWPWPGTDRQPPQDRRPSDCESRSAGRARESATAPLPVHYSVATPLPPETIVSGGARHLLGRSANSTVGLAERTKPPPRSTEHRMKTARSSAVTSSQEGHRPFHQAARRTRAPRGGPSPASECGWSRRTAGASCSRPLRFESRGHYVTHSAKSAKTLLSGLGRGGWDAADSRLPQIVWT